MAEKKEGAYGAAGGSGPSFRKTWDVKEYQEKAKEKDRETREFAQEQEDARRKGKRPPRKKEDLPKPTERMKAREGSLELDKNVGKTVIVNATAGGRGPGQPGYFCDVCSRNHKDSQSYLDHLNSRGHLKRLGQTTRVARSTLDQVRLKIAQLREQSKVSAEAKQYDFDRRIKEIRASEEEEKQARKEKKRLAKLQKQAPLQEELTVEEEQMKAMMGFSGFGGK